MKNLCNYAVSLCQNPLDLCISISSERTLNVTMTYLQLVIKTVKPVLSLGKQLVKAIAK